MATIMPSRPGKRGGLEHVIASMPEVQDWLDEYIFEAGVRAEQALADHHYSGAAEIDIEAGDVDRYLILSDEAGQKAAMSIEFGRAPFVGDDGRERGGMDGLFVLHRAVGIKRKSGKKVKL